MDQAQQQPKVEHVETECPKCGHKFWHKVGHVLKVAGQGAAEVVLSNLGAFSQE